MEKSNHARFPVPILLARSEEHGATLRPATSAEVAELEEAKRQAKVKMLAEEKRNRNEARAAAQGKPASRGSSVPDRRAGVERDDEEWAR